VEPRRGGGGGGRGRGRGRPPLAVATPDQSAEGAELSTRRGNGPCDESTPHSAAGSDIGTGHGTACSAYGAGGSGGEQTESAGFTSPFASRSSAAAISQCDSVPSPKTPAEERRECARTLGSSLVRRYQDQRRQSQALRRASLTTSMIITPTYWRPSAGDEGLAQRVELSGSVASRKARSKQRHLSTALGDLSGGGSLLSLNELGGRKKKLIFGKSAIHSWGLYAAEPIEKEDFVVEYLGEYVRSSVANKREEDYRRLGYGDDYIFRVDGDLLVDATRRGGLARFANHCCEPNCYTRIINAGGKQRIVLYSKERIEKGEEITYDYKFEYEEERSNAIPCCCGAKACKGYLN